MNYQAVNEALDEIVQLRNDRYQAKSQTKRHQIDKKLQLKEAQFLSQYGDTLHEVMLDIQDEYFSDSDMDPILYYLAERYRIIGKNDWGNEYQTDPEAGRSVAIDDFPRKDTHLVIVPNPLRVVLHIDSLQSRTVWTSQKPTYVS